MYKLIRRIRKFGTLSNSEGRGDIIVDKSRPMEDPSEFRPRQALVTYRMSEEVYEVSDYSDKEREKHALESPIFTIKMRTVNFKGGKGRCFDLQKEETVD